MRPFRPMRREAVVRRRRELTHEEWVVQRRLELLGLKGVPHVELHENHTVMVTLTKRNVVRLHRGYYYAPDSVLRAVVTFVTSRVRREERARAERELLAFPVSEYAPPPRTTRRRPARLHPGDVELLRAFMRLHRRFNTAFFGGRLSPVRFRISSQMRTRLGELTLDERTHRPAEIAIARRHVERDAWEEVEHTLLHEMVHQWQAESGLAVDHGPTFRRKAMEVGVAPAARRLVRSRRRAARYG